MSGENIDQKLHKSGSNRRTRLFIVPEYEDKQLQKVKYMRKSLTMSSYHLSPLCTKRLANRTSTRTYGLKRIGAYALDVFIMFFSSPPHRRDAVRTIAMLFALLAN